MKSKTKFFNEAPVNIIIIPVLFMFLLQAFMSMFYNNSSLTFYSIHSFHSLSKAEILADTNWTNFGQKIPGLKEINGFLYPVIVSFIIKLAGKYNVIPLLYVISFFVYLFISIVFYKVAYRFLGGRYPILATVIFIISAPVMLSVFSGADILFINLLFVLNIYYIYFYIPVKHYKPAIIVSVLLLLTNYTGIIYGLSSLFFIILCINEKRIKENFTKNLFIILSGFILFCIVFCGYVFIDDFSPSFFEKNILSNTKTFFVDTFFKDGFLWAKIIPPFLSVFFFMSLYIRSSKEIREKKISFSIYILIISIVCVIMEFFSVFSVKTDTFLFISPFLFLLILLSIDGIFYTIELLKIKNAVFSRSNLLLGLILFVILYNMVWTFTITVEKNNDIRQHQGNIYVEKFFEK